MSENAAPCERCPLQPARAVASRGPVPARVLMLSGAPRHHEEHDGVAFASPAFDRMREVLAAAGIDPAQIHYATLTGCRPPYQRPLRGEEIGACAQRLDTVIAAVQPEVIVVCGPDAVAAMLPGITLAGSHGELIARGRRRYYPIRHPYAALHYDGYIAEVTDDLRRLGAMLANGALEPARALDDAESGADSSASEIAAQATPPISEQPPASESIADISTVAAITTEEIRAETIASEAEPAATTDMVEADLEDADGSAPDPDSPAQLSLF